jgi:5-formyltetrahydrofolate cyclo-ligase
MNSVKGLAALMGGQTQLSLQTVAMPLTKSALREQALARRGATPAEAAAAFAAYLATEGLALVKRLHPDTVSAYFPLAGEPSTLPLLEKLGDAGIKTALPVTGRRGTPLQFRLWRHGEPTVKGKMAIEEPLPEAPEAAPDLLFVPLAAFDRGGHRIGYGAGFYDRTLAELRAKKTIWAVGVAYASQELAKVPHEAHDESLDFVLTERELIDCRAGP